MSQWAGSRLTRQILNQLVALFQDHVLLNQLVRRRMSRAKQSVPMRVTVDCSRGQGGGGLRRRKDIPCPDDAGRAAPLRIWADNDPLW